HVAMLAELAAWHQGLSLESKVAAIVARHARFAGSHHKHVRVGGRALADMLAAPDLDLAAFLAEFREARQLRRADDGPCRFIRATKFGGPMFGIFDEREAAIFARWAESVQAGDRPEIVISANAAGDERAAERLAAIAAARPADVVIANVGDI